MTLVCTRKFWRQNFLPFLENLNSTEEMGHYTTKEACYFPFLNLYFVMKMTLFGFSYCKEKVQILPVRHLGFCQNQKNFTLFAGFEVGFNEKQHVNAVGGYLRTFFIAVGGVNTNFRLTSSQEQRQDCSFKVGALVPHFFGQNVFKWLYRC